MGFFKRLYTGEICPIESVVRDTAEFSIRRPLMTIRLCAHRPNPM